MANPYEVLGVAQNATTHEIKSVYRELVKKYHPDNYNQSPLRDIAEQKMAEINRAFDDITKQRELRNDPAGETTWQNNQQTHSKFFEARTMIKQNKFQEADQILSATPYQMRDGEWHFLKGSIYFAKGWLEEATNHFHAAYQTEPNNQEYRSAFEHMQWQAKGNFGSGQGKNYSPYQNDNRQTGGCGVCDICAALVCVDCLCGC